MNKNVIKLLFLNEILSNIIAVRIENNNISGVSFLNDTQSVVMKGIFPTIAPRNVLEKFKRINTKTLINMTKLNNNLNLSFVIFGKFLK